MNTRTCSFVNTMPKYIHANINPIYLSTNRNVINMHMYTNIHTRTHASTPITLNTLAHHPHHLPWQVTHPSTPLAPPTLIRQPRKHATLARK